MLRRHSIPFRALPTLAFVLGIAAHASAQITHLETPNINGPNASTPSLATGRGDYTLNTSSHLLKYNISFSGLTSAETLAHIHGPAPIGMDGPPIFGLPLGSPITGSFATTGTQETNIAGSLTYVNIHTVNFPNGEIRDQLVPSPAIGTAICLGDGTGSPCPCGNSGAAGHGCENSSTTGGALLKATGHNSPDNVVLIATGERPTATTVFLSGTAMVGPFLYGDGLRCVGGTQKRLAVKSATGGAVAYPEGAEASITARSAALGSPITPGTHRFYLAFYRDPDPIFCTANTFNASNTVDILW